MRSADLRTDLTRVPDRSANGIVIGWRSLLPGVLILTVLLLAAWHAGRESGQFEGQRLSAQLDELTRRIASNQLELERQQARTSELEKALQSSGKDANLSLIAQLHSQLLKSQAEANQYKTILQREQQDATENSDLVEVLSTRGARLLALKGSEAGVEMTAYALLAEKGPLLLIASRLPKLANDRQFQLWVSSKEDPKPVSAGVFRADDNDRALMTFSDFSLPAEPALLVITDEPRGGSSEPTGPKLLESAHSDRIRLTQQVFQLDFGFRSFVAIFDNHRGIK